MVIHQRFATAAPLSLVRDTGWTAAHLRDLSEVLFESAETADRDGTVGESTLDDLHRLGVLTAPFDRLAGGHGLLHAANAQLLSDTLRALGAGDLSVARLVEGHYNAVALVCRYGDEAQRGDLERATRAGALSGVWGADGAHPLKATRTTEGWHLAGGKILASGAGLLARPLVTATSEEGQLLFLLDLPKTHPVDLSGWTPQGMRSSQTGTIDLTGLVITDRCRIGQAGDFMRQPHFSGGAWRFCAAHVGAMERLVDLFRSHLVGRGRGDDPYQLERVAKAVVAVQTARFWIETCATRLAEPSREASSTVAFANLTRMVTERAALDVMEAVQRGVGLSAFIRPSPIERLCRDLATYLRQPVPDLAMADGARTVLGSQRPMSDLWGDHAG